MLSPSPTRYSLIDGVRRGKKAVERREKSVAETARWLVPLPASGVEPDSIGARKKTAEEGRVRGERKDRAKKEEEKEGKKKKRGVTIVRWPLTAPVDAFYFELAYLRRRRSHRACKPHWFQYYSPSSHGKRERERAGSILRFRGKLSRSTAPYSSETMSERVPASQTSRTKKKKKTIGSSSTLKIPNPSFLLEDHEN